MSARTLILTVRFHAPRFHGRPEWPPSPARLFQAVVAGASPGLDDVSTNALRWWERQDPPVIAAPLQRLGTSRTFFVPNNDLDAKKGDPAEVASLRVGKQEQPRLLEPDVPIHYLYEVDDEAQAQVIAELASGLYQLGRGVDPAFATGRVCDQHEAEELLRTFTGTVHRPTPGASGDQVLLCPTAGTIDSLNRRHAAQSQRIQREGKGRSSTRVFRQPPKATLCRVAYDCPPRRFTYVLHERDPETGAIRSERMASLASPRALELVVAARDGAHARLASALPDAVDQLDGALIGRRPGETSAVGIDARVRIIPLPSIGHAHADGAIRRLLVEVPQRCPIRADDVAWAFEGLQLTVDGSAVSLVPAVEDTMSWRYLRSSRRWHSVTAVALPQSATRRRVDPVGPDSKGAQERAVEEGRAMSAVVIALRQAGVSVGPRQVHVQREPFDASAARADEFHDPPRFSKHRMWHVAIELEREVQGPIVLGDGRFLGLGLMAPDRRSRQRWGFAWTVDGLETGTDAEVLARALRRATLSRAQAAWGEGRSLPSLVTGHANGGAPAQGHAHLSFHWDPPRARLMVVLPPKVRRGDLRRLDQAFTDFRELRAGQAGLLTLAPVHLSDDDPLLGPATEWRSVTPYAVRRHAKRASATQAVAADVRAAAVADGKPAPEVVSIEGVVGVPGRGLQAMVHLRFATPVAGPLMLGRTRHRGGGLFAACRPTSVELPAAP